MQVKKIEELEWKVYVDNCPEATFFHTPMWYKLWNSYFDYGFEARLFTFESGRKALLPLGWKRRLKGLIKDYFSGPLDTYGGLITNDALIEEEIESIKNYLHQIPLLRIHANPFIELFSPSFYHQNDFTQLIDIRTGWDVVFKKWSKGHASAAKKGIREGVKIEVATANEWKEYYEIYLATFDRWGSPPEEQYTWKLFNLLEELKSEECKLWLAKIENKIIAGAVCFYFNNHVVYWHGASLKKYFSYKPVHVLQYFIIQDAIKNNFDWYDFNPSGAHKGVEKFKKGFGASVRTTNIFIQQSFFLEKIFQLGRKLRR